MKDIILTTLKDFFDDEKITISSEKVKELAAVLDRDINDAAEARYEWEHNRG